MSREYPRYAGKIRLGDGSGKPFVRCALCAEAACGYADVQYTWFRSDDEAYPVCEAHLKLARQDVAAFVAGLDAQQHNLGQSK